MRCLDCPVADTASTKWGILFVHGVKVKPGPSPYESNEICYAHADKTSYGVYYV